MANRIDPFKLEILWKRLISAVDEAATALERTAFSASIRDANDYGVALIDADYNLIVQCTLGTPGLFGAPAFAMREIGKVYPHESLQEGDVIITNDPWVCTGHLDDITLVTPIFRKGRLIAYSVCIAHEMDIGGRMMTTETREVYEEGLFIPILKFYEAGRPNDTVFRFLRANIRVPDNVIGDLRAQLTANDAMARRLQEVLDEYGMDDVRDISSEIITRTETAVRAAIRRFPEGSCHHEVFVDKFDDQPVKIAVSVTLKDGEVLVDFRGTSDQIARGVNVCLNYTRSYTVLAVKAALAPSIPNNEGGLRPIRVIAPEGSILNCRHPAPVNSRSILGTFLPEVIFCALSKLIPDRIMAGSGSTPSWPLRFAGQRSDGRPFVVFYTSKGGLGARSSSDGIPVLAFPGNSAIPPVEVVEGDGPVVFEKRELGMDSAGPGRFRGGPGHHVVIRLQEGALRPVGPVRSSVMAGRIHYAVPGLLGGHDSPKGIARVNGVPNTVSGRQVMLQQGDTIELITPGGGGYGDPLDRDLVQVEDDVRNGLVSPKAAWQSYGALVDENGHVNVGASMALRASRRGVAG